MSKSGTILVCLFILSCFLGALSDNYKKETIIQSSMIASKESSEDKQPESIMNFNPSFNVSWPHYRAGAFDNIYSKLFSFVLNKAFRA